MEKGDFTDAAGTQRDSTTQNDTTTREGISTSMLNTASNLRTSKRGKCDTHTLRLWLRYTGSEYKCKAELGYVHRRTIATGQQRQEELSS